MNTRPQIPDSTMKTRMPRIPAWKRTPMASPTITTGMASAITKVRSAVMSPSNSGRRRTGVITRRSK